MVLFPGEAYNSDPIYIGDERHKKPLKFTLKPVEGTNAPNCIILLLTIVYFQETVAKSSKKVDEYLMGCDSDVGDAYNVDDGVDEVEKKKKRTSTRATQTQKMIEIF